MRGARTLARAPKRARSWQGPALAAVFWLVAPAAPAHPDETFAAELVERGRYLAIAGDCAACHTKPGGGAPFAGGYAIATPVGTVYSSNITPSLKAGIGGESEAQFAASLRQGIGADGTHLYPAMPYSAYAGLRDDDVHALFAYFRQAVAPVDTPAPRTHLGFPFGIRASMVLWNALFLPTARFVDDPSKSGEWNRGAYLVRALEHCSACHSPRNLMMAEKKGQAFAGGPVSPWYAPNITSDPISGIGGWSRDELLQYLRTGASAKGHAGGGMAEVVSDSLQYLRPEDLDAVVTYLVTIAPIRTGTDTRATFEYGTAANFEPAVRGVRATDAALPAGAVLYSGNCASCHQPTGAGSREQTFPRLFHDTVTGASQADNVISTILFGIDRDVAGHHAVMPRFDAQSYVQPLTDGQIAAVASYVFQQFGNPQIIVTSDDVARTRKRGP